MKITVKQMLLKFNSRYLKTKFMFFKHVVQKMLKFLCVLFFYYRLAIFSDFGH